MFAILCRSTAHPIFDVHQWLIGNRRISYIGATTADTSPSTCVPAPSAAPVFFRGRRIRQLQPVAPLLAAAFWRSIRDDYGSYGWRISPLLRSRHSEPADHGEFGFLDPGTAAVVFALESEIPHCFLVCRCYAALVRIPQQECQNRSCCLHWRGSFGPDLAPHARRPWDLLSRLVGHGRRGARRFTRLVDFRVRLGEGLLCAFIKPSCGCDGHFSNGIVGWAIERPSCSSCGPLVEAAGSRWHKH